MADLNFVISKSGTSIKVQLAGGPGQPEGGNGRVKSGQTIRWDRAVDNPRFSLLLREVHYVLTHCAPGSSAVPLGGWTPMANFHEHTVGNGPYYLKYWVMLEDNTVMVLDPGIIIDN